MKKRLISIVMVFVMMISFVVPVYAAESATFEASTDTTMLKAGDSFTVTATIPQVTGIASGYLKLMFDKDTLEVQSINAPTQFSGYSTTVTTISDANNSGTLSISIGNGASTNFDMTEALVLTATFAVRNEAAVGDKNNLVVIDTNNYYFEDSESNEVEAPVFNNTTITGKVISEPAAIGYSATLSSDKENDTVRVEDTIEVSITTGGPAFNAAQMELTYDNTYLTYNANSANGGTNLQVDSSTAGKLILSDFGGTKNPGTVYELTFTGVAATGENTTPVAISKIGFSEQGEAIADLAWLSTNPTALNVTVAKSLHTVTLPEGFVPSTGEANDDRKYEVEDGSPFSFTPTDTNYTYTFTGANVTSSGDTYTVESVTGDLTIVQESKTGKTRNVEITAPDGVSITAADGTSEYAKTVQYPNDYTFKVNTVGQASSSDSLSDGYYYEVTAKIGETPLTVTATTPSDKYDADTYTITGTAITGDVTITVTKIEEAITRTITISGTGKDDAKITKADGTEITARIEESGNVYTVLQTEAVKFVLTAQDGYKYTDAEGNTIADYNIEAGVDAVAITVNKTIDLAEEDVTVEAEEYLTMNSDNADKGGSLWLVTLAKERIDDGHHYEYASAQLVWSTKYKADGAYYMLIQADEQPTINISDFSIKAGADAEVKYDGNVNGTTSTVNDTAQAVIDVNDAQMVYNMYNAYYGDMDAIGMVKFLEADMNASKNLNTDDALAVLDTFMNRDGKTTN